MMLTWVGLSIDGPDVVGSSIAGRERDRPSVRAEGRVEVVGRRIGHLDLIRAVVGQEVHVPVSGRVAFEGDVACDGNGWVELARVRRRGESNDVLAVLVHAVEVPVAVASRGEDDLAGRGPDGRRVGEGIRGELPQTRPVEIHQPDLAVTVAIRLEHDLAAVATRDASDV